jgi:hypothetical protein
MGKSYNAQAEPGMFIPLTNIWDVQAIQSVDVQSPEFKELLVRLYQNVNNICFALNIKDTGYYVLQDFVNGQAFFPNPALNTQTSQTPTLRQVFRKVFNAPALANTGVTTFPHFIPVTSNYSFTRIYGAATNNTATGFIPLPFASPVLANNISLAVTNTNIVITTGSDYSAYTIVYIILEYIKE